MRFLSLFLAHASGLLSGKPSSNLFFSGNAVIKQDLRSLKGVAGFNGLINFNETKGTKIAIDSSDLRISNESKYNYKDEYIKVN